MHGSNHAEYAEGIKRHQITGFVLASTSDEELSVLLRSQATQWIATKNFPIALLLPAHKSLFTGTAVFQLGTLQSSER
jgi:hypothetical protein